MDIREVQSRLYENQEYLKPVIHVAIGCDSGAPHLLESTIYYTQEAARKMTGNYTWSQSNDDCMQGSDLRRLLGLATPISFAAITGICSDP